jgi:predicted permease
MIPIALTIIAATWAGLAAERRWPERAGVGSRKALTGVLYTVLPAVVFLNLNRVDFNHDFAIGIALGWVVVIVCAFVTFFIGSRFLALERPQIGALLCCVLVANTAYLGYPLTVALLGHDDLSTGVLFDVLVSGPALMLGAFGVAAAFGERAGEGLRQRARAFFTRNPPLYAAILGLLAPDVLAPTALVDASQVLAVAILPIGFFAVGATLAEGAEQGELPFPPPITRPVALAVGGRLILAPALLTLLAAPLIDLPSAYRLMSAMPTGINAMVVSHAYGLDNRTVAEAITWSTALVVVAALLSLLF